ncbi:MAG: hypothetical protein PHQ43_12960 [Dehalococcoidales bacterium]|nr:hypothetical protein [Dehalococcoidales bacterium]
MPSYFNPENYVSDEQAIADGLFAIARAIRDLGNADAATPMGAIEALGKVMKEGSEHIAAAIEAKSSQTE